jgi:aminodeoxyfutalosine deaminase
VILRARTILPVSQPPIENGAIFISGNKIRAVGSWADLKSEADGKVLDLGEVILLPGLVNAHCHLDYTDMAGELPPPKTFTDWIPLIMAAKSNWGYADFARSWLNGAKMLLRTGTTTVADIEAVPDLLPEVWDATPLRVFSFLEMTGIRSQRGAQEILRETAEKMDSLAHEICRVSISPHAPYSTSPELLKLAAEFARKKNLRLTTHVAESADEFEMFAHARGKMFDWLKRSARDNSDCGLGSPVQHLERTGLLGENFLAVHANYLGKNDFDLLAKRNVSVVHCPGSHDYFRHDKFPLKKLLKAKINVCLGTDSLSTARKTDKQKPKLNMFAEMLALAANEKTIKPEQILKMATINGSLALGMAGEIGELSENAFADLIAIPFSGKIADIYETVLHHASTVSASMVDGKWAIAP